MSALETKARFAETSINSDARYILDAIVYNDPFAPGTRRQAMYLLQIKPQYRTAAWLEGNRICNSGPGWRPSDALQEACKKYRNL